ncbi:MAG TPA: hypothetical protein VGM90_03420 [Kofleriaceae bacterium]|jgi:hypothetical protein
MGSIDPAEPLGHAALVRRLPRSLASQDDEDRNGEIIEAATFSPTGSTARTRRNQAAINNAVTHAAIVGGVSLPAILREQCDDVREMTASDGGDIALVVDFGAPLCEPGADIVVASPDVDVGRELRVVPVG